MALGFRMKNSNRTGYIYIRMYVDEDIDSTMITMKINDTLLTRHNGDSTQYDLARR